MPQMSPLRWFMLMLFFSFTMMLYQIKSYFNNLIPKVELKQNKMINYNFKTWKW